MKTFSDRELKLIQKVKASPTLTTLKIQEACPLHSYCDPLPLFRVYKIDDERFEAQWNDHHNPGVKQVFRFGSASL